MREKIELLHTEQRNPKTCGIGNMDTLSILERINDEDQTVAVAVRKALGAVAQAVELIVPRMRQGGRIVYVGAGTSGRLGFMDAAECGPTYGVSIDTVTCVMAGGREAVFDPKEANEDDANQAKEDLKAWGLKPLDTVVAVAASGRTPYCIGALDYAREIEAGAVSISCNADAIMSGHAQVAVEADTGSEVIMGSTRMKAGTAQKMIMNMLSTTVMVKLGRTYDNLMVCLNANNQKIGNRVIRLFNEAAGLDSAEHAKEMLSAAGGKLTLALLMEKTGCTLEEAQNEWAHNSDFNAALKNLTK